jgi:hypothetical protein
MIKRVRPALCPCEHSPQAVRTQTDPSIVQAMTTGGSKQKILKCGAVSADDLRSYDVVAAPQEGVTPVFGLPFTLETLLPIVAR